MVTAHLLRLSLSPTENTVTDQTMKKGSIVEVQAPKYGPDEDGLAGLSCEVIEMCGGGDRGVQVLWSVPIADCGYLGQKRQPMPCEIFYVHESRLQVIGTAVPYGETDAYDADGFRIEQPGDPVEILD